jgi:O-acetyl-ADP-ribose deacetylase (regulator of RNase III)
MEIKLKVKINNTDLLLLAGDITQQEVEAIVNAANSSLMGGGGVDGAIHRAGGPEILKQCKEIIKKINFLPTGEAVITTGGNLKAKYVIHTVGPIYKHGKNNEAALLRNAYRNSLKLAKEHGLKTIAFPSISTGAYRFPLEKAAKIALKTIIDFIKNENHFAEIRMVLFGEKVFSVYREILGSMEI